jgi:hypothetical protein
VDPLALGLFDLYLGGWNTILENGRFGRIREEPDLIEPFVIESPNLKKFKETI